MSSISEGRITRVNHTGLVMLGYASREMVGQPVWEFVVEQDVSRQAFYDKITGAVAPPPAFERTFRRKNGTVFPALVQNRLLRDAEDRITGIRSTILDVTERKQMVETLRESEKRLRLLSSQILTAQENERKRIARELHDGLGQILTAVKFKVEETCEKWETARATQISEHWRLSFRCSSRASRKPGESEWTCDLPSWMTWESWQPWDGFAGNFKRSIPGISLEKQVDIQENDVPDPLKTVIYRVLQEAMHNIAKHSNADFVSISLKQAGERIELLVRDNGRGFDLKEALSNESSRRGLGLSSMRERTELSSGHFTHRIHPGRGHHDPGFMAV